MERRGLNQKGLNYYYNIAFSVFLFFSLFIAGSSFAQEFTATTIHNYDDISVIEVAGNYDTPTLNDPNNAIPRQVITNKFYESHEDKYDFLVIFSNFDFQMPRYQIAGEDVTAAGFYHGVRNDVQGIGKAIFDNSSLYGSNGVLQGTIDMGYIEKKTSDPLDPGLASTMRVLCHEIMHRWGAYVKFKKPDGTISGDLLGSDDAHWSYLLDSKGSMMYGNRWQENGDGTFTSLPGYKYYSPLDLYLMGLIDKSEVPPMLLIENPDINPEKLPDEGEQIVGIPHYITIDDVIEAEGERFPGHEESQKEFKIGFILITRSETPAQDKDLQAIRNIINNGITWFSALTDGKARLIPDMIPIIDIPGNPGITPPSYDPRTAPQEINDGVAWLIANQMDDGSWKDSSQTIERDTSEAVLALRNFSTAHQNHALGLQWLLDNSSLNTDYLSRKIEATILSGGDVSESLNDLLLRQNPDGGWGSHVNYTSNPMDTALALSALAATEYSDSDVIGSAIEYLKAEQNPDFGWGNGDQESLILTTTNVLSAFCHFRDIYELQDQIENGILWLLGKQNTDGGFGNSPSTVYDTAVAILALKELGVSSNITNDALDYIETLQSEDGSWYTSPFQTALAVRAIWKVKVDPDLSVETGEISLSPETVTRLPQEVQIDALIRNNGLTDVPEVKVFLYKDVMSESNKIAEQVLNVSGASSETATFTVTITDGDSHRFYVSVDQEGLIAESSESNNIALKMLYPEASHDFEIESSGISSSPMTADLMQDIFITSHIRNNGTMNAYDVLLRYYIDIPGQPLEVASITVDIPAGTTIEHTYQWTASVAGSNLNFTVQADPNNTFTELSEENNLAFTPVTVNPLTNPNLHFSHEDIVITPSPANQGGDASIAANITNNGATTAENVEVRFAKSLPGEAPVILSTQIVPSIAAGENTNVAFNWVNIDETGERIIYIQVDPLNQVQELREDDNEAFTNLDILSYPDFTVSTSSIVFTPSIARDGDMVSIQTTVQNRGEQDISNVPVTAYDESAVIASGNIDLIPGNSQAAITFYYDTTGKSGVHKIMVTVDVDDIIREQDENNNSASRFLGVQDSNMWVSERYISPNGDGAGDSTEFFFSIGEPQTVRVMIVDADGNAIRTFSGEEFKNTTGVFVTWDGLGEDGRLVKDGDYTIQVVSEQGTVLGSLIVTVDNNLSPLTDAIGTEYLLQTNLTCFLPDFGSSYYNSWQWLPDESGIIFLIERNDTNFPEYPAGLYRMGPDGEDVTRLTPWMEDANYRYEFNQNYYSSSRISMSVDGNGIYFVLKKYNKIDKETSYELWSIDQFGENLALIEPTGATGFSDIAVSPNGAYIAYNYYSDQTELRIAGTDGSGNVTIAYLDNNMLPVWSSDGQRLAYYSNNMIYITNPAGEIDEICPTSGEFNSLDWIGNEKIFFSMRPDPNHWDIEDYWLVDASEGATPMNLASGLSPGWSYNPRNEFRPELIKSSDGNSFAFIDNSGTSWTVKVCDNNGDCEIVHESPKVGYEDGYPSINDLRWSDEGSRLAFIDWAYEDLGSCFYNAYLVVFDRNTDQKSVSRVATSVFGCEMPGSFYIQIQDPDSGSWIDAGALHFGIQYQEKELDLTPWMKDRTGPVTVRITQKGLDAANIDNIALITDRELLAPNNAVNITKGEDVLAKLLSDDRDVIDAYDSTLEIVWNDIPESRRVLLSLNAREEDLESRKASPFRYPQENFYSVKLSQDAPIVVDGMITSSDALPEVLFKEFSTPITGHPNGYSYGYIKTDGEYLYAVLDFTPDNTLDHGRDWAGLEILTSGGSKSFVINDAQQEYGATSMAYTDRVDYEHKVYEFKIPLEEINAQVDDTIQVAFLAYGTAGDNDGFDNYIYQDGSLRWFKDGEFLLAQDDLGLFAIDYLNDEKIYLPILDVDYASYGSLSPRGRYLTYNQYVNPDSACYGMGSRDLWRISSLLNLTANLRVSKKDSNIILKGIAADGHFDHYVLEYADKNTPDQWSLITPPSDVMVIDDALGTWIPPYPGSFYVRLSVYDKAGNMEWDRKRVSWGLSTSIAGLYLTEEYISPNGDGTKDFIELHYQILEPVHLEFYVYDQDGNIIRTFLKEYTEETEDHITWDGRDDAGYTAPDGSYIISVSGQEFPFVLDNTPPEVTIEMSDIKPHLVDSREAEVLALALDDYMKGWILEYGEGENPEEWYELRSGTNEVKDIDKDGDIQPRSLLSFNDRTFESAVGKKYRISAEDYAGNRITQVSGFLEEIFEFYAWEIPIDKRKDKQWLPLIYNRSIPFSYLEPGSHNFLGTETVRLPITSMWIQYLTNDMVWVDGEEIHDPLSGLFELTWDNSELDMENINFLRVRAVDVSGKEHFTQSVKIGSDAKFKVDPQCDDGTALTIIWNEDVKQVRVQVQKNNGNDEAYEDLWVEYPVLDIDQGDTIPINNSFLPWHTNPAIPPLEDGDWVRFIIVDMYDTVHISPLGRAWCSCHIGIEEWVETGCYFKSKSHEYCGVLEELKGQILREGETEWVDVQVWNADDTGIPVGEFGFFPETTHYKKGDIGRLVGTYTDGSVIESNAMKITSTCTPDQPDLSASFSIGVISQPSPDCGTLSMEVELVANLGTIISPESFKSVTYYILEGGTYRELEHFDLEQEDLGTVILDTSMMTEGYHTARVDFEYLSINGSLALSSIEKDFYVDNTLPEAQIDSPNGSTIICPMTDVNWKGEEQEFVEVKVMARDNHLMNKYQIFYSKGQDTDAWIPAKKLEGGYIIGYEPIDNSMSVNWDVTDKEGDYTLALKVWDASGNLECHIVSIYINEERELSVKSNIRLFSPNDDSYLDTIEILSVIEEAVSLDLKVYREDTLVRTLQSALEFDGGSMVTEWDGRNDSGSVVPDGIYRIEGVATDLCGNIMEAEEIEVEVDNTPPTTIFTYPQAGDLFGMILEIMGTAYDNNFKDYLLEADNGQGTILILKQTGNPVQDGFLGTWKNFGLQGIWDLKLTATDKAGNTAETLVTVDIGDRVGLVKELSGDPILFAPNGDDLLDVTHINYAFNEELNELFDITLSFYRGSNLKKAFNATSVLPDPAEYIWDGKDEAGTTVEDGSYKVTLRAALSSDPLITHEESISLIVDTTPPAINFLEPVDQSYIKQGSLVKGSITDPNMDSYSIVLAGSGGETPVSEGAQNRLAYQFANLADLEEGQYTLKIQANDLAENSILSEISFNVDKTPPEVTLTGPEQGTFFGISQPLVYIRGLIEEENIDSWVLRYGVGANPDQWTDLITGDTLPASEDLFTWNTGEGIPDGVYTLSLYVMDKAGWEKDTKLGITVDRTLPEVSIVLPEEHGYVKELLVVKGTASDDYFDRYALEISDGECDNAYRWVQIADSVTPVENVTLGTLQVLPEDGSYCVKLTATDKADNTAVTKTNIIIDTLPPSAPVLSGEVINSVDGSLLWSQNPEPDVAGYILMRNGSRLNNEPMFEISYLDEALKEGNYTYRAMAVDFAGWESEPSNEVTLKIDLSGPTARITSPAAGSVLNDLINIKGTAYSQEDFKEYRLYIGEGTTPATWNLIRQSPVPIAGGVLTQYSEYLANGEYSLKLEAEDLSGNINTDQVSFQIDDDPPAAPVLLSANVMGSNVNLQWETNNEPDLSGYLLYRNGELVNASEVAIVDLRPYLITGTDYVDAVPDGNFVYYLEAMDEAGNISEVSNSIEVEVDTRIPQALIETPFDGSAFEHSITIIAVSPDLDIESVQFQYKSISDTVWTDLGSPVLSLPYVAHLDPVDLNLVYGEYQVRAIATDIHDNTDENPQAVNIVYTDLTAPDPPTNLTTHTDGGEVTLTWTDNDPADDLEGYNVYMILEGWKIRVNEDPVSGTTTFIHSEIYGSPIPDNPYTYEVTAVDTYDNESDPSNEAAAIVYTPVIQQPYTPSDVSEISLMGSDTKPGDTIEIFVSEEEVPPETSLGNITAGNEGDFSYNVGLNDGINFIWARAEDEEGNRSRMSEVVALVFNEPPETPTGLTASAGEQQIDLSWNPNTEDDLAGYNLYRDDVKVNAPVAVSWTSGTASASMNDSYADRAFDDIDYNYWYCYFDNELEPVWWEVELSSPELINRIEVTWTSVEDAAGDYEIQAWSGYSWVTIEKVTGNNSDYNEFQFAPSYRTDRIRIYITKPASVVYHTQWVYLSEVKIQKDVLITGETYEDTDITEPKYSYKLTAVDYYGFESLPTEPLPVGNFTSPDPPLNLTATADNTDIDLNWTPSSAEDLSGYNVYRQTQEGWVVINPGIVPETSYRDMGLHNGTYTYRVTAVDMADNESEPSNEDSASVNIQIPGNPDNLTVSDPGIERSLRVCWEYNGDPVAGFNIYRSTQPGGPYDLVNDEIIDGTCYDDTDLIDIAAYYYIVSAVDQYGNESPQSNEGSGTPWSNPPGPPKIFSPTISGFPLKVGTPKQDIIGFTEPSALVELFKNWDSVGTTYSTDNDLSQSLYVYEADDDIEINEVVLSPDGQTIAYMTLDYGQFLISLELLDVSTGGKTTAMVDPVKFVEDLVWSPDSQKLVYSVYNYMTDHGEIYVYDVETAGTTLVFSEEETEFGDLKWSPDSSKVAYDVHNDYTNEERIYLFDSNTGNRPLTDDPDIFEYNPSWSSDSTKIVFVSNRVDGYYDLWINDLLSDSLTRITEGMSTDSPVFSPDDKKIMFKNWDGYELLYMVDIATGTISLVDSDIESDKVIWSPDGGRFAYRSSRNGDQDIYVYNTVSGSIDQITTGGTDSYFSWSPDGQNLVYIIQDGSYELWISPAEEFAAGRSVYQSDEWISGINWTRSGNIYFTVMEGYDFELLRITPGGLFKFPDVLLDDGENEFYATATDESGNVSLTSEAILLTYDAMSYLPDLEVLDEDIMIYPAIPLMGEETSIYAFVNNNGPVAVENVDVIIYIWNSQGELEPIEYEVIPYIDAGAEMLISGTWDSSNSPGENAVIVEVDGYDVIMEITEDNNTAFSDFYVAVEEGIEMATSLNKNEYMKNEDVRINIDLHNSGASSECALNVQVEDSNGGIVHVFDPVPVSMSYAQYKNVRLTWNTGSTYAGDYQVRSILKENSEQIQENLTPFKVLPDLLVGGDLTTDKTSYNSNEDVLLDIKVRNNGSNYIIPHLDLKTSIIRYDDVEVFNEESDLNNIPVNSSTSLASTWNTDISPSGTYTAVLQVFSEGELVLEINRPFEINPSVQVSGTVKAVPEVLFYDNPVRAEYTVTLGGNTSGGLVPVRVVVVDPDSQAVLDSAEATIDPGPDGTASGWFVFNTTSLRLKTYKMFLQYSPAGDARTLATAAFTVKDGTPPMVTILSPEPDSIHCNPFDRLVKVTDDLSGVDRVEYRIDDAEEWIPMPAVDLATSRYGSRWTPVAGDEGPHTIYYRAADRAGNVSEPVSVNITIISPFELLTGTISAEPDPVYQGMQESFNYTINNEAGNAIQDLIIRIHIVDPVTGQIVETLEEVETISGNSVYNGVMSFIAALSPEIYDALLDVELSSAPGPRTLNSTDFEVLVVNNAPVADAGEDRNIVTGEPLTLDGSSSYDPDGEMITFMWSFTEVPDGSSVTDTSLSDATSAMPTFTPDVDGTYILELEVDDGALFGVDDVVLFSSTPNVGPNSDAGPDQNALTGTVVQLDGSGSTDPDNGPDPLSFEWTFDLLPVQSLLTDNDISNWDQAEASFIPDVEGTYIIMLSVSDGDTYSDDTVQINVASNVPPNADAGEDFTITLNDTAMLDGSGSYDPDEGPEALSFAWQFVSVPDGSTLTNADIYDADTAFGYFTPDVAGIYVLALMVGDSLAYDTDNIAVTVTPAPIQTIFDLSTRGKSGKISLLWTPVEGADCYNIYRGTSSGSYSLIQECRITDYATYLDTQVIDEVTYYYVVTSVTQGVESLYSNEAPGVAPARRTR